MYKKSNSKGFSLFELLVVIVIISILSGLGFVTFKTTLDRTKESLAISNLINIDEFVRTELFVINHNIIENAPHIKTGDEKWKNEVHSLNQFISGLSSFFDIYLDPTNFLNPFQPGRVKQVYSETLQSDTSDPYYKKKGSILFRLDPDHTDHGSKTSGNRFFQMIYYEEDNIINPQYTKTYILE